MSSAFLFNGQMAAVIHFLRFKLIRLIFIEFFLPWFNHINNKDLSSSSQCCKTVKSLATWTVPQNSCSRSPLHWSFVCVPFQIVSQTQMMSHKISANPAPGIFWYNPESKMFQVMEEYPWNLHGSYRAPSFKFCYEWGRGHSNDQNPNSTLSRRDLCTRTSTSTK